MDSYIGGDVAKWLNWVVHRLDEVHVPYDFVPYSAEEVARLRRDPLVGDAYAVRRGLLQAFSR